MVVNLLSNAAKWSENAGRIDLTARVERGKVVVMVRDRGVDIPPKKLPAMFDLFTQGDRSLARSEGGLGIGLTVFKKSVELHGGMIGARSEGLGHGSESAVQLPAAPRPSESSPRPPTPSPTVVWGTRILVADNNVDTARRMTRLLKLQGHAVTTAHDGHAALAAAKTVRPEFFPLDIGLPGMDGYDVAVRLRRLDETRGAVVIAISGFGQEDDRRRSREAGFDHHLVKPLDHDVLASLLAAAGAA